MRRLRCDSRNRLWTYDRDGVGNITQIDATADCSGGITLSQDVTGPEEHESCAAIEVGPDVTVTSSGSLDLTAATQVAFKTGFAVEAGGSLKVALDPALSGDVTKDYTYQDYDYFLKTADGPWGSQSWTYDKIGNRTSETDNGWTDTYSYVPNPSNSGNTARLDAIQLWLGGMRNFSYTPAGHQTQVIASGNTVTFDYDDAGRLKEASRTGGASSPFVYDGRGFLRQAGTLSTATGTVLPTYDSSGLLHALLKQESSTEPQRRYHVFYLAGRPVAQLATETGQADRWWYLTTDHLGTPIVATDTNGAELWESRFEPFGEDPNGQALANEMYLRLPGQWEDGTWEEATEGAELMHNVHRNYFPAFARYNRTDPFGLFGGINVFAYVGSNPIGEKDPLGLARWTCSGVGFQAGLFAVGSVKWGTCWSDCSLGYRWKIGYEWRQLGLGVATKLSLPGGGSLFSFDDGFPFARPDNFRFLPAQLCSTGFVGSVVIGGGGSHTQFGSPGHSNFDDSGEGGFGFSLFTGCGRFKTYSPSRECCDVDVPLSIGPRQRPDSRPTIGPR